MAELAGARKSFGRSETSKRIHGLSVQHTGTICATTIPPGGAIERSWPFVPPLRNGEGVRG
jgi:hypothetical protein